MIIQQLRDARSKLERAERQLRDLGLGDRAIDILANDPLGAPYRLDQAVYAFLEARQLVNMCEKAAYREMKS
jgi:exonuclease VII small subunit